MIKSIHKQSGVSLIELMIGMLVGLIVVGGVATVYVATVQSSGQTLRSSRLNQEMGALMQIMTNDIRRAGFWGAATADTVDENPFSVEGQTALSVRDVGTNADAGNTGSGDCILYSYDLNIDDDVDTTDTGGSELFGFKLDSTAVDMRTGCSAGACTAALADSCTVGSWTAVTDASTVSIDALTFDLGEAKCINVTQDAEDCYTNATVSDDLTVEIREVKITLTASLVSDSTVRATMTQTVRVRNDMIRIR